MFLRPALWEFLNFQMRALPEILSIALRDVVELNWYSWKSLSTVVRGSNFLLPNILNRGVHSGIL